MKNSSNKSTNMTDLFYTANVTETVNLKPSELVDRDINIQNKVKAKNEGKCIQLGFVKKDSLNIIRRSVGYIKGHHFTSDMTFDVTYSLEICNPSQGNIINCIITNVNNMGVLAKIYDPSSKSVDFTSPLSVIVARQHQDNIELLKDIEIDTIIQVEVIGK